MGVYLNLFHFFLSVGIPELNIIRSQASLRVLVQREDNKYNTNMHLSYQKKSIYDIIAQESFTDK